MLDRSRRALALVVLAVAVVVGGRVAAGPVTFESERVLRVFAVSAPDDPRSEPDCLAGDVREVGTTPSDTPVEIPPCVTWYVAPGATDITGDDATALVAELVERDVPGISLRGCAGVGDELLGALVRHRGLRYLDLRGTNVTEKGLARLARHPSLRWLDVADLQPSDLTWLRGMPELVAADLSGAWVTGGALEGPAAAPRLERLVLRRGTDFGGGVLHPLKALRSLRALDLSENARLSDGDVPALAAVPALEHLSLARCGLTDAAFRKLAGCVRLTSLDVSGCDVDGSGLADLGKARRLTHLGLRGTRVGDGALADLAGLKQLRSLDLSDTEVTDAGLESLARHGNLGELALADCNGVTAAGIPHLAAMTSLRVLVIEGTGIPRTRIREIERALPRCSVR